MVATLFAQEDVDVVVVFVIRASVLTKLRVNQHDHAHFDAFQSKL
jgi:hypothetical protein